jgi:hypothetical protein
MSGKVDTYWCRYISASYPLDWGIKVIEGFTLHDLCADFAADTKSRETTLDDEETAQRNLVMIH